MRKISICFLTIICILGFFNNPAFAWHGQYGSDSNVYVNVHYSDTRAWCIEKGVSQKNAEVVATSDSGIDFRIWPIGDYMDDGTWHLNRVNYVTADKTRDYDTRLYWFDQKMADAKVYLKKAGELLKTYNQTKDKKRKKELQSQIDNNKKLDLQELGYALHPLQDRWAHLDAGINTLTEKVGRTHGMLDALAVNVLMPNGTNL